MHIPKPAAYFYRSQSGGDNYDGSRNPYVKIANFYQQNSPKDRREYGNCEQVRLYRGSTLIGTQQPDTRPYYVNSVGRPSSTWNLAHPPFTFQNVEYQANTMLIAEGLIGNAVVARDTVRAPQNASTIRLIADPPMLEANSQDISRIEAYIIDDNGTWLHAATNSVRWSINGSAAELVGDNPIRAQAGACIILAKATSTAGVFSIKAESDGLTAQTITVTVSDAATKTADPYRTAASVPTRPLSQWYGKVFENRLVLPAAMPLPASVTLFNLAGIQLYRGVVKQGNGKISESLKLPKGIYLVKVGRK